MNKFCIEKTDYDILFLCFLDEKKKETLKNIENTRL